ncbi:MAG: FliM/FliN family flagellar motor C-terminal domain-containing protein [Sulfitobacter sp.]
MSTQTEDTILRRKVAQGRKAYQAKAMSVQKALRLCAAKVADAQLELALSAIGITQAALRVDGLTEQIDDTQLLILLDGPEGRRAGAMLDAELVTGLIQQQTMGMVTPGAEAGAQPRSLTATDAAVCAPFLDGLLEMAAPLPEEAEDRELLRGYRFGARAQNKRLLLMALEAPDYHIFRLTLDIANGQRQGKLALILPDPQAAPAAAPQGEEAQVPPGPRLGQTVLLAQAELQVILAQLRMSLAQASQLQVGQVLPLPEADFDRVSVMTLEGRKIRSGMLGQLGGLRALRVDMAAPLADAPRRRAQDRADLDQPEVQPMKRAKEEIKRLPLMRGAQAAGKGADLAEQSPAPAPQTGQMPDMSDLPGMQGEMPDAL